MNTHEVALRKGEGRSIWLLGDLYTFKLTGEALSVTELTAFPENGPPPHIHQREDESFWVLDGEFSVLLGEGTLTAGQGAFVHIPKGMLYNLQEYRQHAGPDDRTADTRRFREAVGRAGRRASNTTDNATSGRCRHDRETDRSSAHLSPLDSPSAAMKRI